MAALRMSMSQLRFEVARRSYSKNHVTFLSSHVLTSIGIPNGVSICEYVRMGNVKSADEKTISAAMSESGLMEFEERLATKLGDPKNDALQKARESLGLRERYQFVTLSGGQKRCLEIAQLLMRLADARLLVLDELESNLDAGKFDLLNYILARRPKNCTVVLITHCMAMTTRGVDWIYVMKEGEIVEGGTHEQLMEREDGMYRALQKADWERQSGSTGYCSECECPKCREAKMN